MHKAIEIVRVLRRNGHSAWLVGGCVRDRLLNLPVSDYDVATDATPAKLLELFPAALTVGAHFGVVLVEGVEVATLRSDFAYRDGRRPERVAFETDPRKDAERRDFTINALFLDPETGEILDFVGGRGDLRSGVIRAIGDPGLRFAEDHLRMLRAVRFAARYGFTMDDGTMAAIRRNALSIDAIAPERVAHELTRMLTEGHARRAFELLDESELLVRVLPEVAAFRGVEQPPEFHPEGDVWTHVLRMLQGLDHPSATLAWGVLLHDVGKPGTFQRLDRIRFNGHVELGVEIAGRLAARLRFSNDDRDRILSLIANHMRFADVRRMKESTLKRFLRLPHFEEHLELHRLDCLSSHGHLDNYEFARSKLASLPAESIRPPRLLSGDDLMAAGWTPGPEFRLVLDQVEDAQLEGRIATKAEAMALAASMRKPV